MKVRVRWNRHTLALLAIVAGMWYAAEAQSNGAAHLIALLTGAMSLLSWLHARANLRGLSLRLAGARPGVQEEGKRIPVELRATGAMSPCGLEVHAAGAAASVFVERVPAGGAVVVELPPPVNEAGGLRILVRSLYPLGLFSAELVVETGWVRRVHPRPAGDLPVPAADTTQRGESVVVASARGQVMGGDDFAGLREWRAGDSPRHIDWRAAARGGPLMVKSWSSGVQGVVVMDWEALTLAEPARAAQLARWMEICEEEGRPYELRISGRVIPAGHGAAHLRRCLDALATQPGADGGAGVVNEMKAADERVSVAGMEQSTFLPQGPLFLMSVALVLAILPMHGYIGNGGLLVCALCMVWRGVLRMGVPHVLVRLGVIVAGVMAVFFEYGEVGGMEPGIALLLVLAGAKMLESRSPREFQVLALIGWFLAFCTVLLENQLSRSIWTVVVVLIITACMVRFRRSAPGVWEPLRLTGVLFAQALPLAVLLFFVFPRGLLDLGSALGRSRFGETGIDSDLDAGSIAKVAQSSRVAFRVRFPDGKLPPNELRYWRCLTLWHCEGMRWTRGDRLPYAPRLPRLKQEGDVRQVIDLEAHGKRWLPALNLPVSARIRGEDLLPEFDQSLVAPFALQSTERFAVLSSFEPPPSGELLEVQREAALQLPRQISPELRRLTDYWESVTQNDEQLVQIALNYIKTAGFNYTLEPGEYKGAGAIEEFFLRRRVGFCEHFSASFATLMRMAGVPSRVVVGYLGGEYSDHNGGYLIVKQSDVHAWVEVWLERYGWRSIDPTAALAPDRVNIDISALMAGGMEAAERQRGSLWQRIRLWWDSVNYDWQNQVIDYNQESQRSLLERLGLRQSKLVLLIPSAAFVLLAGALVTLWLRRPARHADPWMRLWQRACRRVSRAGVPAWMPHEGPLTFARRVNETRPDLAAQFEPLATQYISGRYGASRDGLESFKAAVKRFRPGRHGK